jgi:hypothetical protein
MRVMNVDPELLRDSAAAALHALSEARIHLDAECAGLIPELMDTLTPEGPYAYTIMPQVDPGGRVVLPLLNTRDEIQGAYEMIRGASYLRSVIPVTEIAGEWYTFQDSISRAELVATGEQGIQRNLLLFPAGRGSGITGELVWVQVPPELLGHQDAPSTNDDRDEVFVREALLAQHARYLDGLASNDVDRMLDTLHDFVASAVRDYVDDTGELTSLEGKEAHREYYEAFFDKYHVERAEALHRVSETWYTFAEVRVTVTAKRDGGQPRAFHRAEFCIPANDGHVIARIGHGTDVD